MAEAVPGLIASFTISEKKKKNASLKILAGYQIPNTSRQSSKSMKNHTSFKVLALEFP